MADPILLLGDLIMLAAATGAVVFAISYASFFAWRKTQAGRALLYFVVALVAVFLNNTAARTLGGDYPGREWIRLAVYCCVAVAVWRLVVVLWHNWRADKPPIDIEARSRTETKENP